MKKFFRNISWSQIFAGALAAVTVFFFSAKIGLAGSIIGVAVASILSTFSSQLYQNLLKESTKKIKKTHHTGDSAKDHAPRVASSADKTQRIDLVTMPGSISPDATAVVPTVDAQTAASPAVTSIAVESAQESVQPSDPEKPRFSNRKKVVLVSILTSLVAVGLTVGIVLLVTGGEGTDTIVRDAVTTNQTPPAKPETPPDRETTPSTDSGADADTTAPDTSTGTDTDSDTTGTDSGTDTGTSTDTDTGTGESGSESGTTGETTPETGTGTDSGSTTTPETGTGTSTTPKSTTGTDSTTTK